MASVLKFKNIFTTGLVLALLALYFHKPLPEDLTDRRLMHILEPVMRLFLFYPNKALAYFGISWQIMWTRNCLNFCGTLVSLATRHEGGIEESYDTSYSGVPVRVYIPSERKNDGAILFIHGGGFVLMNVEGYDAFVRELVRKTGMVVVSIDYRLAPEHIFPAGLNDCEQAVISFLTDRYKDHGVDPNKVVIMGDSAGGNLATVVARKLSDKPNLPQLKLQVLVYPVIQFADMLTPSYQLIRRKVHGTAMVDPESLARYVLVYLGIDTVHVPSVLKNNHTSPEVRRSKHFNHIKHDILPDRFKRASSYVQPPNTYGDPDLFRQLEPYLFNPDVTPIMSHSLAGLPRSLVVTCEYDPLRDEGYWYMERMRSEGVDVDYIHYEQGFHAMLNFYSKIALGRQAFADIADFILKNID